MPGNWERKYLLRCILGSGALRVSFTLLNLGLAIVLARALGPEGYGIYAYTYALVSIIAIPAQSGLPTLVVREVANYHQKEEWGFLRGILRYSNKVVLILSAILLIGSALVALIFVESINSVQFETFSWALLLIPLVALGKIRDGALRGLNKVVQGQIAEMLVLPGLLFVFTSVWLVFG